MSSWLWVAFHRRRRENERVSTWGCLHRVKQSELVSSDVQRPENVLLRSGKEATSMIEEISDIIPEICLVRTLAIGSVNELE